MRPASEVIWRWRERADDRAREARTQRVAGVVRAAIAGAIGGALVYFGRPIVGGVALSVATLTLSLALVSPLGAYAALDRAALGLGRLVGRALAWLLLAPFYYLVLTPLALVIRRGRDPLARRLEPDRESYWSKRGAARPLDRPY